MLIFGVVCIGLHLQRLLRHGRQVCHNHEAVQLQPGSTCGSARRSARV